MGSRKITTILDVTRENWNLSITCSTYRCRHRRVIDAGRMTRLAMARSLPLDLNKLSRYFRCTKCGARYPDVRPISAAIDDGRQPGPGDEREYKALIKRLRG